MFTCLRFHHAKDQYRIYVIPASSIEGHDVPGLGLPALVRDARQDGVHAEQDGSNLGIVQIIVC